MRFSPPYGAGLHGNHHLPVGLILSDEVGIMKELQGIEVVLFGDAEESSFLDCHP
jgi:hypothetical protein